MKKSRNAAGRNRRLKPEGSRRFEAGLLSALIDVKDTPEYYFSYALEAGEELKTDLKTNLKTNL